MIRFCRRSRKKKKILGDGTDTRSSKYSVHCSTDTFNVPYEKRPNLILYIPYTPIEVTLDIIIIGARSRSNRTFRRVLILTQRNTVVSRYINIVAGTFRRSSSCSVQIDRFFDRPFISVAFCSNRRSTGAHWSWCRKGEKYSTLRGYGRR